MERDLLRAADGLDVRPLSQMAPVVFPHAVEVVVVDHKGTISDAFHRIHSLVLYLNGTIILLFSTLFLIYQIAIIYLHLFHLFLRDSDATLLTITTLHIMLLIEIHKYAFPFFFFELIVLALPLANLLVFVTTPSVDFVHLVYSYHVFVSHTKRLHK